MPPKQKLVCWTKEKNDGDKVKVCVPKSKMDKNKKKKAENAGRKTVTATKAISASGSARRVKAKDTSTGMAKSFLGNIGAKTVSARTSRTKDIRDITVSKGAAANIASMKEGQAVASFLHGGQMGGGSAFNKVRANKDIAPNNKEAREKAVPAKKLERGTAEHAVATMYGMGTKNAIKGELEMKTDDMLKKMKDRLKILPSLERKDYTITERGDEVSFISKFGVENIEDQKHLRSLLKKWEALAGPTDPEVQRYIKSYNRRFGTMSRALKAAKQTLMQRLTPVKKQTAARKPTVAEAKLFNEGLRRAGRGGPAFVEKNEAIARWAKSNTAEFKRMVGI